MENTYKDIAIKALEELKSAFWDLAVVSNDEKISEAFNNSSATEIYSDIFTRSFDELNGTVSEWCDRMIDALSEKIYTTYAPDTDITFIMKEAHDRNCETLECIGWYHGEPNEDDTNTYSYGNMKATYIKF